MQKRLSSNLNEQKQRPQSDVRDWSDIENNYFKVLLLKWILQAIES